MNFSLYLTYPKISCQISKTFQHLPNTYVIEIILAKIQAQKGLFFIKFGKGDVVGLWQSLHIVTHVEGPHLLHVKI